MDPGLRAFENVLARIEEESGRPVERSAARAFELLMPGDFPLRATVHPRGDRLVVDIYLYNAVMVTGAMRAALVRSLLLINQVALRGRRFALALDNRDYALLTSSVPLDESTADRFAEDVAYLLGQAGRIRGLIEDVTLARAEVPVEMELAAEPA